MSRAFARQTWTAMLAALLWCQANSWSQVTQTSNPADFAIEGRGWFVLRHPVTGQIYVTRMGNFCVDPQGYFVGINGMRVQGYSDASLSAIGDVIVDNTGAPSDSTEPVMSWDVDSAGRLNITLYDNTAFVRGQILLQNFQTPDLLTREAHNLYTMTPEAGPLDQPTAPDHAGLGKLLIGWIDETPEPVRLSLLPSANRAGPLSEGVLTATSVPTDLGIKGPGFFLVRDTNNSNVFATRAGLFLRDGDGYLITYDGLRVQGYSDPAFIVEGDVRIDSAGAPNGTEAPFGSFSFYDNGQVEVTCIDNTVFSRGQILLYAFAHPQLLTVTNCGRYAGVVQAGPQIITSSRLRQGAVELINVTAELLSLRNNLKFFSQGFITNDAASTHLAISGNGFFVLRSPSDGIQYVTRAGAFQFDDNGYLINAEGLRVQGYATPELATLGDIRIDSTGSSSTVSGLVFDSTGQLNVQLSDGTSFVSGQVLLQSFGESYLLKNAGPNLYTNLAAALPLPQPGSPGTSNLGRIFVGALELPSLVSPQLTLPSRDGIRIKVTGEPGRNWIIQAANNPGQWSAITQINSVPDELEFTDTESKSFSQRFYRVMVSEP